MIGQLAEIWRHPIKAIGREQLSDVTLEMGCILPHDRVWAVAHEGARAIGTNWAQKSNFLRGVTGNQLMAVTCEMTDDALVLRHPSRPELAFDPNGPVFPLLEWLRPLWPADQPTPTALHHLTSGFTDVATPWISINSHTSHAAVEQAIGHSLSHHRWRGNLWVNGFDPWDEFQWIGKTIAIGDAELHVHCPITRCKATMANPETGERDADTLAALRTWKHQDFGVYAEVTKAGAITPGAKVHVL